MKPKQRIIFIGFIALSIFGTILTFIFNRDAPPVAALEIPKSTKDFFKRISDLGHIKFDFVDSLDLGDFDNDGDYSEDFKKLEDENFIVYYHDNKNELTRAQKTLEYANMAIPELASFFGKYYYAKDANNRKLAIYLAVSQDDFNATANNIGGSSVDWAAGLTFNSYSSNGDKKCKGIILNSMVQDGESADLKKVVFHEMAHYNHFQCMDLIHKNGYMNWEVEGLASYFAKDWNKQIPSEININDYNLKIDPSNYADSYWMGYHVFDVFEEKYANSGFKNMLIKSFSKSLEISIPEASNESFDAFQNDWRNHCDRLKGQISATKKQIQ
jgi:hypothetical protein